MRRNLVLSLALAAGCPAIALAKDEPNVLVVLHSNRPKLTLLDADKGRRLKTFKLEREGTELEVAADGTHVYVSTKREPRVAVVDLTEKEPERTIEIGGSGEARGLGMFNGQLVVAVFGASHLVLVDPASGDVKKRIEVNRRSLDRLVVAGSTAYVSDTVTGDVVVVDLNRGVVENTVSTGATAGAFAVDPSAGEIWVADRVAGTLRALASKRAQVVRTVPCPGGPTRVVIGGGRIFALCVDTADIAVLRPGAQTLDRRIPIRPEFAGSRDGFDRADFDFDRMVIAPGGKRAFLSGGAERRILVLDLEALQILDRFDVDDPIAEVLCIKKAEGIGGRKSIHREKLKKEGEAKDEKGVGLEKENAGEKPEKKDGG